jgi:protein transport protein SEC20
MSTADTQSRLKTLFDATKTIASLTTQLAKWAPDSDHSASSTPLNRSTSNLPSTLSRSTSSLSPPTDRLALSSDIHQRLRDLEEDYDLLSADSADLTAPPARRLDSAAEATRLSLTTQLQRLGEDIVHLRSQFRKAQLQAKRTADASARKERAQLFAGLSNTDPDSSTVPRRRKAQDGQGDDAVRDAAQDVTEALRRTHQRMTVELQRGEFARSTLQRSSQALQSLNQSYGSLDDLFKTSRGLITSLAKSNKSDTWYLETALWILVATVIWLFFRRIVYGPFKLLVWFPASWVLRAVYAIVNVVLSVFAGSAAQTGSVTSSRVLASGKGATRHADMPAPSMNVGGGGKSGERQDGKGAAKQENLADQVGKMAEDKQAEERQGTVLRDRRPDEPKNPKKKMWEEPVGKDEL